MSHHVLHLLTHGARLHKVRGRVVCRIEGAPERSLPIEDLRAIIIAAQGVTITSSVISAVLERDVVILHCNPSYRPCGYTTPCSRTIDPRALLAQGKGDSPLHRRIWMQLLEAKIANQAEVLELFDRPAGYLRRMLTTRQLDEAQAARRYWREYFPILDGISSTREKRNATTPANRLLNYGYAVLAALIHRSIAVHGLHPSLGVQHRSRYRSYPLVYDLMEPLRPLVDRCLAAEYPLGEDAMTAWCRSIAKDLIATRVIHGTRGVKLLDAVDLFVSSVAMGLASGSAKNLWIPRL